MNVASPWHRALKKLPPGAAAALGFAVFVGISLAFVMVLPPAKNPNQQCTEQCKPRSARLVPDKDYPMGKTGYRTKCECY